METSNLSFRKNIRSILGSVVCYLGIEYTVIDIRSTSEDTFITLMNRHSSKAEYLVFSCSEFKDKLCDSQITISETTEQVIDYSKFPSQELGLRDERVKIIERFLSDIYPNLTEISRRSDSEMTLYKKKWMASMSLEMGMSNSTVRRLIIRYLQSGRNPDSLLNYRFGPSNRDKSMSSKENPRGRGSSGIKNTEELLERYSEFYNKFLAAEGETASLKYWYDMLIMKYYRYLGQDGKMHNLPKSEKPSYKRFCRWAQKQSDIPLSQVKLKPSTRINTTRPLPGTSRSGVAFAGDVFEIDEVELDDEMISFLSFENNEVSNIGRAVMYCLIDAYSSCIVSCWIGYRNNSFTGFLNVFWPLLFPHSELLSAYGITVDDSVFPSMILPNEIRTDQGSEYLSNNLRNSMTGFNSLGIFVNILPARTGSLKSVVESSFHSFQQCLRNSKSNSNGIIRKDYDSSHKKSATYNIIDTRKAAYEFVKFHNCSALKNFILSPDMVERELKNCPCEIWNYSINNISSPRPINPQNRMLILYRLLPSDRAFKLSRFGISYKKTLFYHADNPILETMVIQCKNRIKDLPDVRYDPRDVSKIYIILNHQPVIIPLNNIRDDQKGFLGMTWDDFDKYLAKSKQLCSSYADAYDEQRYELYDNLETINNNAIQRKGNAKNNNKNTKKKRDFEKDVMEKVDASIRNHLLDDLDSNSVPNDLPGTYTQDDFADKAIPSSMSDSADSSSSDPRSDYISFMASRPKKQII